MFKFQRTTGKRALAKNVLQLVEEGDHYNQKIWINERFTRGLYGRVNGRELRERLGECGTKACVAGNVAVLSLKKTEFYDPWNCEVITEDGSEMRIKTYAAQQLGLDYDEASWLFSEWRPIDDVKAALRQIMKGKRVSDLRQYYPMG